MSTHGVMHGHRESPTISAVAYLVGQAQVSLRRVVDRPGAAGALFARLSEAGCAIDFIAQNSVQRSEARIIFTLPQGELKRAVATLTVNEFVASEDISLTSDIGRVGLEGAGFASHPEVIARTITTIERVEVSPVAITSSSIAVSCMIPSRLIPAAVSALQGEFSCPTVRAYDSLGRRLPGHGEPNQPDDFDQRL